MSQANLSELINFSFLMIYGGIGINLFASIDLILEMKFTDDLKWMTVALPNVSNDGIRTI